HRCKTRTFKVLEAEEENGEQQEIETSSLDIEPDELRESVYTQFSGNHILLP
nr:hypothetical protein [Tanacetum cinerariifolium]GFB20535.1 hypothetical protein [Tanacetum cinerariifolium]